MKHEGWGWRTRDIEALGRDLSDDQIERLATFEALVRDRAIPLGMVAATDRDRLGERHIQDSLRAAAEITDADRTAYDLGSGAGFPGVVVAVARPSLGVTLVESRRPRAAFLQLVLDRLELPNASVSDVRVETLAEPVDVCFSRAFARVGMAWQAAERILLPRGRLIYFAGERFDPSDLPERVAATMVRADLSSALARSGPLVIMSRQ